jgi:uncharacterized membrane protein
MSLIDKLLLPIAFAAALGSGLVAGIFFAFSNFVMKALARVPDEHGMRAMQAINVTVLNPLFLTLFLGTAAMCVFLGIVSIMRWNTHGALSLLIGSLLYFVGNFVVTRACNVPRNDALARLDATNPAMVGEWRKYIDEWTRWNHVRTITATAAAAAFIIAIYQQRGP